MTEIDKNSEFISKFELERSNFDRFCTTLKTLMSTITSSISASVFSIDGRVKERPSIEEKLSRPDKDGKYDKLSDMTDLCGIRVVAFDNETCNKIISSIRMQFEIDEDNSIDKSKELDADRFGYASTHLIIKLKADRAKLFEYESFDNLVAEIQIRTVLQHAWAVLDHKLRYKSEIEAPKEVRRKLFRISALLEAADEAFLEISKYSDSSISNIEKDLKQGDLNIPINKDSIQSYIRQSPVMERVFKLCDEENVRYGDRLMQRDTAWPYLLRSLEGAGIITLYDFELILKKISRDDVKLVHKIFNASRLREMGPFSTIRLLVFSTFPPEVRLRLVREFPSGKKLNAAEIEEFSTHS